MKNDPESLGDRDIEIWAWAPNDPTPEAYSEIEHQRQLRDDPTLDFYQNVGRIREGKLIIDFHYSGGRRLPVFAGMWMVVSSPRVKLSKNGNITLVTKAPSVLGAKLSASDARKLARYVPDAFGKRTSMSAFDFAQRLSETEIKL